MEFRLVKYVEDNCVESYPLSALGTVDFDTVGIYNERNDEGLQYFEEEIEPEVFKKVVQCYTGLL